MICESPATQLDAGIDEINAAIDRTDDIAALFAYSPSCHMCADVGRMARAVYADESGMLVLNVNVDAHPATWEALGLEVVPTILLVGKGRAITECRGATSPERLRTMMTDATRAFQGL